MSQTQPSTRVLSQNQEALLKTYQKQLKDDIKSMVDNFVEIIRMNKIDDSSQILKPTQSQEDQYEMNVRAANIVRAGESLMKLVSDLKQFLILNDFTTVNEAITNNRQLFKKMQNDYDQKLLALRDDMASTLYELEDEYYSSVYK